MVLWEAARLTYVTRLASPLRHEPSTLLTLSPFVCRVFRLSRSALFPSVTSLPAARRSDRSETMNQRNLHFLFTFLILFSFLLYFSLFIICFPQHFGHLFSLLFNILYTSYFMVYFLLFSLLFLLLCFLFLLSFFLFLFSFLFLLVLIRAFHLLSVISSFIFYLHEILLL